MRPLRPGQDTVLSWPSGAMDCRVIAAAGAYVLLSPTGSAGPNGRHLPEGASSLTYLDGMIPMGWDGTVEMGGQPGELRFKVSDASTDADRRSAVRIPVFAAVNVTVDRRTMTGQMLDVSAGGLRCRLAGDRLEIGRLVHVGFELPQGGPAVGVDAVVRASEPGIAAVEFSHLHSATRAEIGAWTVAILRSSLAGAAA